MLQKLSNFNLNVNLNLRLDIWMNISVNIFTIKHIYLNNLDNLALRDIIT